MNARGKLNVAYFNGSVVLAIVAGVLSDSCGVTVVILACGLLASLLLGNIRPSPHR